MNTTYTKLISFFTQKFESGASYSSLNSSRSALSIILDSKITSNDNVNRFLKGVYRLKPPNPKYNETWDTNKLLSYVENVYPYDDLDLADLSRKTLALLAIASAQRMQTLSLIKLSNINVQSDKIIIKITDLVKTSRPGAFQPLIRLPFIKEKPCICPATALLAYMEKTSSLRHEHTDYLFIGIRKPHMKVGSQTLGHWVKKILHDSGIDISVFGAHSTRHASTSTAHRLGVNLDMIRKAAGWSNTSNVFFKYYCKNVVSDSEFAEAIFNNL